MGWILIGFVPALAWGLLPLVITKIGGKPANQILGTTMGTLCVAIIVWLVARPDITLTVFFLSLLSGAAWAIGQIGQYQAYKNIGVSKTMPFSTGLQLIGTSLIGVFVFGEWAGTSARVIGFTALAVVVVGVFMTTLKRRSTNSNPTVDNPTNSASANQSNSAATSATAASGTKATYLLLFFTTFGYLAYSAIPDLTDSSGIGIFLPQAAGMVVGAILYIIFSKNAHVFKEATTWKTMLGGLLFGVAAMTYILSANRNGIATAFVLSQLSVVISTLGGIFILKEKKARPELVATMVGLGLIVAGSVATAFI